MTFIFQQGAIGTSFTPCQASNLLKSRYFKYMSWWYKNFIYGK